MRFKWKRQSHTPSFIQQIFIELAVMCLTFDQTLWTHGEQTRHTASILVDGCYSEEVHGTMNMGSSLGQGGPGRLPL